MTSGARRYKRYLLGVLLVILCSNYADRSALGLVMQDIKVDLDLTDTQLGFLTGIAFAAFYSLMGVPIAYWADRGDRVGIIALTTALWSAMVALCGVAANFLQLLLIRVGVAVGEAGCIPTAHSLIAEYFPRAERPRAVAIYLLGAPLSMVIGYFLTGWVNESYGWRTVFFVIGLPGLMLAALARITLKEPRGENVPPLLLPAQPGLREVAVLLWVNSTFRHLLFSFSVASFFGYGILQWQPAFFIRSFGLRTGELGTELAAIYAIGGVVGTYWGGVLASRHAAHDERLQLKAMAVVFASIGGISAGVYLSPTPSLAFGLLGLYSVIASTTNGPLFAAIQTLVPERMRAVSIAFIYLFANLIGMGLGPLATGALSDAFQPWAREQSLRYALLSLCPGYLWVGWHLWRASRTVIRDLARPSNPDVPTMYLS